MNKWLKILAITSLMCFVLLFAYPSTVQASMGERGNWDRIVAGGDFTLASGEVLSGNLINFGGNVVLEQGSRVYGDVLLFGGTIDVYGDVYGDVLSFGGSGTLHDTAVVEGSLTRIGGDIATESNTIVKRDVVDGETFDFDWFHFNRPFIGDFPITLRDLGLTYPYVLEVLWLLFISLLMAALAIVVMLLFPTPTGRIGNTSISQVIVSWGLGFLTALVLPFLLVLLAITIVLIPITLIGFLGMAVAMFFGWIAIGYEIGHRFDQQLNLHWSPPVSAGLGTFILTLVSFGALKLIPCLGWLLPFMIVIPLGLGAVLLTRFGTQVYPLEEVKNGNGSNATFNLPPATSAPQASPDEPSPEQGASHEDSEGQSAKE